MLSLVSSLKSLLPLTLVLLILQPISSLKLPKCMNDGVLMKEENQHHCVCPSPFTGRYCEDVACVNGLSTGEQFDPSNTFFSRRCLCDIGWTGELCDKSLINRCGENGGEQDGKCVCHQNFVGDRCQYVTKCTHGQLYNGRCACHYGWAGDFCDKIICHQGYADEKNEACICPSKYRGKYCDFCAESASSPPPECGAPDNLYRYIQSDSGYLPIIMVIVTIFVLIVLGAVFYLLCKRMNKMKRKLENARQSGRDPESRVSATDGETAPLNSSSAQGDVLTIHSEKFYDAPPPYSIACDAQQKSAKVEDGPDSGLESGTSSTQKR